nr:hypothetical protein CFP56_14976 [Quercus suber]
MHGPCVTELPRSFVFHISGNLLSIKLQWCCSSHYLTRGARLREEPIQAKTKHHRHPHLSPAPTSVSSSAPTSAQKYDPSTMLSTLSMRKCVRSIWLHCGSRDSDTYYRSICMLPHW